VARGGRYFAGAVAIALFAFFGGFVIFASSIAHFAPAAGLQADGIVVLTGGEHRLSEAARLLAEGRGTRLLISGVNRATTRHDLHRKTGLSTGLFERVDVGYAAHDTSGNAEETKAWAITHGFSRLIIVTSSYHMPRSLTELGRAMPAIALIPYPVVSGNFRTERWWMHGATARLLFFEYLKFLPSAARFCMGRLFGWDNSALADSAALRALRI
jgi:uncharacterized SAM-binding protein YcdF (DUF218 family)